jgi:hypothetical protein
LAPKDHRQEWHLLLTERNEARLPQKQRTQLINAKDKCERAQKRNVDLSYSLVEFLGTHEFGWVREADVVQNFDALEDPNERAIKNSKRGFSRSAITNLTSSKMYAEGLEECEWAVKEFEHVLQEAFDFDEVEDDTGDDDGIGAFMSYSVMNLSDDEADEGDRQQEYKCDVMQMQVAHESSFVLVIVCFAMGFCVCA